MKAIILSEDVRKLYIYNIKLKDMAKIADTLKLTITVSRLTINQTNQCNVLAKN